MFVIMSLNNYHIKLLAAVLMLIDHIGVIFFPTVVAFRLIGRFSFPLFILLLVDGEKYTRNSEKYGLRLLLLGLLSQPIFQLVFNSTRWNILFTLFLGLICLRLVRLFPRWQLLIWLVGSTIAQVFGVEYQAYGILAIALISHFQMSVLWWLGWIGLHLGLLLLDPGFGSFQLPAILVPWLLPLANHQAGPKARWFYLFYPFHLLALWLVHTRL